MSATVKRSFAFIDVCGFTSLLETSQDDGVRCLLSLRAVVREAAEVHGVRVAKWLGDGSMLVAVHHDDLERCLRTIWVRAAGRVLLPLRGGMATGTAIILEGDDYIGTAVNLAARLCAISEPAEVLALCETVGAQVLTHVMVRGVSQPVPVRRIELSPDVKPCDEFGMSLARSRERGNTRCLQPSALEGHQTLSGVTS